MAEGPTDWADEGINEQHGHCCSFRVRDDGVEVVRIPVNGKVEPPVASYPGLPDVSCFIVLLGAQTGMPRVLNEELCLLVECFLHPRRRVTVLLQETWREEELHFRAARLTGRSRLRLCRCSDSTISSAVSNGP